MSIYTNLRRKHPKGKVDVVLLNISRSIEFVLGVYLSKDYLEYFSKKGVKKVFRNLGGRAFTVLEQGRKSESYVTNLAFEVYGLDESTENMLVFSAKIV